MNEQMNISLWYMHYSLYIFFYYIFQNFFDKNFAIFYFFYFLSSLFAVSVSVPFSEAFSCNHSPEELGSYPESSSVLSKFLFYILFIVSNFHAI